MTSASFWRKLSGVRDMVVRMAGHRPGKVWYLAVRWDGATLKPTIDTVIGQANAASQLAMIEEVVRLGQQTGKHVLEVRASLSRPFGETEARASKHDASQDVEQFCKPGVVPPPRRIVYADCASSNGPSFKVRWEIWAETEDSALAQTRAKAQWLGLTALGARVEPQSGPRMGAVLAMTPPVVVSPNTFEAKSPASVVTPPAAPPAQPIKPAAPFAGLSLVVVPDIPVKSVREALGLLGGDKEK